MALPDTQRIHAAQPLHGPNSAFVTKELDLEEMEHANFDPEVAATYHEDGLEEADLGYWDGGDYGLGHDPTPEGMRWQHLSLACLLCGAALACYASAAYTRCQHGLASLTAEAQHKDQCSFQFDGYCPPSFVSREHC